MDLTKYEKRIYSQHGQDGIINKIFQVIGTTNKYYIEFRVYDGTERNTKYLMKYKGWNGHIFDTLHENNKINLHKENIVVENANIIFKKYNVPKDFDLLSISINYNDYYVLRKILETYKPRVILIKYNINLDNKDDLVTVYDPDYFWDGTEYYGASANTYKKLFKKYGYTIIYYGKTCDTLYAMQNNLSKHFKVNSPRSITLFTTWRYFDDYLNKEFMNVQDLEDFDTNININLIKYLDVIYEEDKFYKKQLERIKKHDDKREWVSSDKIKDVLFDYIKMKVTSEFIKVSDVQNKLLGVLSSNKLLNNIKKVSPKNTLEFVYGDNRNNYPYSNIYFYRILNSNAILQSKIQKEYLSEIYNLIVLNTYIDEEDIVMDVGTNIGTVAIPVSKMAKKGKVLAYEPLEDINHLLRYNIKRNGRNNIIVHDDIIGGTDSIGLLYDTEKYKNISSSKRIITIDSLKLNKVDVIKVDSRRMINEIMNGAKNTIQKYKPLLLIRGSPKKFNESIFNIFEFCKNNSYDTIIKSEYNNYFIVPRGRKQLIKDKFFQLREIKKSQLLYSSEYTMYEFIIQE